MFERILKGVTKVIQNSLDIGAVSQRDGVLQRLDWFRFLFLSIGWSYCPVEDPPQYGPDDRSFLALGPCFPRCP